MEEQENIYLNPHNDKILGVIGEYIYFKGEYSEYIIVTKEKEYFKILKEYIKTKRDYCERYDHFCGVFGEFYADKYRRIKDITLNEYFDVEDDGKNDGMEMKEVPYPVYLVSKFNNRCDMEHG